MTYLQIALLHLCTVLPAFAIGGVLLLRAKGTPAHRWLGRIFIVLMFFSAGVSLLLPAKVGPQIVGHFGLIHLLSVYVLYSTVAAWRAARGGQIARHQAIVKGLYGYGLVLAGSFALMPGRLLHQWIWG